MGTQQLQAVASPAVAVLLPSAATLFEHFAYEKRRWASHPFYINRRA